MVPSRPTVGSARDVDADDSARGGRNPSPRSPATATRSTSTRPSRRATALGRLVVQGGLTTGLFNALVAMELPGPGSVFLHQEWDYPAPVYVGDTVTAEAEVIEARRRQADHALRCVARREDGTEVLRGECVVYTMRPDDGPADASSSASRRGRWRLAGRSSARRCCWRSRRGSARRRSRRCSRRSGTRPARPAVPDGRRPARVRRRGARARGRAGPRTSCRAASCSRPARSSRPSANLGFAFVRRRRRLGAACCGSLTGAGPRAVYPVAHARCSRAGSGASAASRSGSCRGADGRVGAAPPVPGARRARPARTGARSSRRRAWPRSSAA